MTFNISMRFRFFSIIITALKFKLKLYKKSSNSLMSIDFPIKIFAIAFFSHLIIKNIKIFKHRYLSLITIFIVTVVINIFSLNTERDKSEDYFFMLLLFILPQLFYSIKVYL